MTIYHIVGNALLINQNLKSGDIMGQALLINSNLKQPAAMGYALLTEKLYIELTANRANTVIYYTTDGSDPSNSETRILYETLIPLNANTSHSLKYYGECQIGQILQVSEVFTDNFIIGA